jgi:hypothetical protein
VEIILKVQVDRTEGRQMSAELVGEELVSALEGESLQVEDSEFDVTSVEAVAEAKGPKRGASMPSAESKLAKLADAYWAARPVHFKWEPTDPEDPNRQFTSEAEALLDAALQTLLLDEGVNVLVKRGKVRNTTEPAPPGRRRR